MAVKPITIAASNTVLPNQNFVSWLGLANTDTGVPLDGSNFNDKTVQVTGTFGAGGAVALEGSNDGTNYSVLTDPQGNALTFTAAKIEMVAECPRYIRPNVTGGDGTTALNIYLNCVKGAR